MVGRMCCAFNCRERQRKGGISFHVFPKDPQMRKIWTVNLRREGFIPNDQTKICAKHFEEDCFDREKFGGRWLKPTATPTIFDFPFQLQTNTSSRNPTLKKLLPPTESTSNEENSTHPGELEAGTSENPVLPKKKRGSYLGNFEIDCSPTKLMEICATSRKPPLKKKLLSPTESNLNEENSAHNDKIETLSSENPVLPKRKRYSYLGDFEKDCSPTNLKKKCEIAERIIEKQKKIILNMRRQNKRLVNKVAVLSSKLKELKEKDLNSENVQDTIELSVVDGKLLRRSPKCNSGNKYSIHCHKKSSEMTVSSDCQVGSISRPIGWEVVGQLCLSDTIS